MRRPCRKLGRLLIAAGLLLLVIRILPAELGPFGVAVLLIAAGLCLLRR